MTDINAEELSKVLTDVTLGSERKQNMAFLKILMWVLVVETIIAASLFKYMFDGFRDTDELHTTQIDQLQLEHVREPGSDFDPIRSL